MAQSKLYFGSDYFVLETLVILLYNIVDEKYFYVQKNG